MFDDVLLFTYIFAGFAGIIAVVLAVLLIKYWTTGNRELLVAMRNFMICVALIDFLYFYMDYIALMENEFRTNFLLRIADMLLFVWQVYFWSSYIRRKSMMEKERAGRSRLVSLVMAFVCSALAIVEYGFLMDGYYATEPGIERGVSIAIELLISAWLTYTTIWHSRYLFQEVISGKQRKYAMWISIMMSVNGVWNCILVIYMMMGRLDYVVVEMLDLTPIFILIIDICSVLLIMCEDFTVLFKAAGSEAANSADSQDSNDGAAGKSSGDVPGMNTSVGNGSGINISAVGSVPGESDGTMETEQRAASESRESLRKRRLDYIAETHFLTERERQVMELAYDRMTNPEIADKLCISKYTVKNHMHNIFDKLDISTRAELIFMIDNEK